MSFLLQAKRRKGDLIKWVKVETAETKTELESLIPFGKESDFKILEQEEIVKANKEDFGKRLRAILESRKLSSSKAADLCGLQAAAIRKYIEGKSLPHVGSFNKLCEGLNISADDLIDRG